MSNIQVIIGFTRCVSYSFYSRQSQYLKRRFSIFNIRANSHVLLFNLDFLKKMVNLFTKK